MFVHWRGLPLWRAMLPPLPITPRTASIPRSPFRLASLRVSFVVELLTSRPSSFAPNAWFGGDHRQEGGMVTNRRRAADLARSLWLER
jgi:hypothetical protein